MTFASNAFASNGFQVERFSGGGSEGSSGYHVKLDTHALLAAFRGADSLKGESDSLSEVKEVVYDTVQESILHERPKKVRNKAFRAKLKALDIRMNLAYIAMLDSLERAYEFELEEKRRKNDEEAVFLLLM